MMTELIHLPAVLADEFSISRSEARRHISQGHVKVNGRKVTDLDVDLDSLAPGDPVRFEVEFAYPRDPIMRILSAASREQEGEPDA